MTENFFYLNRNEKKNKLFFKKWLPSVYLTGVKNLRGSNIKAAESKYRQDLEIAIKMCGKTHSKSKQKLTSVLSNFKSMTKEQRQTLYKELYTKEKEKRKTIEQERNINIIQENIRLILNKCKDKIQEDCSDTTIIAYTEIINCLERLDLSSIQPEVPLASGVIDLSNNEDFFSNLLSSRTKQILMSHTFCNGEFPKQIHKMINDFVSTYENLRPDFDPASVEPVTFPRGEMSIESRRVLMTTFDLLEALRHIWSCRPLLAEDEYSENSYIILAVSKILNPIFSYSKWPLKRAWSEKTSKSSQSRMIRMEATNSGKKPDLQVLLKLDMMESELVLAEISRLVPNNDKKTIDRKKLIRICKDSFDERHNFFFNKKDDNTEPAKLMNTELGKVPILGIQVIQDCVSVSAFDLFENDFYRFFQICELTIPLRISSRQIVEIFLKKALGLKFIVENIITMTVNVKDEINNLPTIEDWNQSSSMMSTTYSPPRNY